MLNNLHPKIIIFLFLIGFSSTTFSKDNSPVNWKLIGPGDADQITSLNFLPNGDVFAGIDIGGIYRSSDNGNNWQAYNSGLDNLDVTTRVIQSPADDNILFVGTRGGLYKSSNYGESWKRLQKGLPEYKKFSLSGSIGGLVIDNQNPNTIYAALGYRPSHDGTVTVRKLAGSEYIYKSTDNGESWVKHPAFREKVKVSQLVIFRSNSRLLFAATNKGVFSSKDSGKRWTKILNKPAYNILVDIKNPSIILAAIGEEGIVKTTDSGRTWDAYNNGLGFFNFLGKFKNRYSVLVQDPNNTNTIYTINSTWGRTGGLYQSSNKGQSWKLISKDLPESWLKTSRRMNDLAISQQNSNILVMGSSRYIYASHDKGRSWEQKISKRINDGWTHRGINVFGQTRTIKADTKNPDILYMATADHKIVRSKDSGASWNLLLKNDKQVDNVWDIDLCPSNDHRLHLIASSINKKLCLLNSTDNGDTWSKNCSINSPASRKEKIRVSPHDCNLILAATQKGLIRSLDTGKTWRHVSISPLKPVVRSISFDPEHSSIVYVGTNLGLYKSNDNAKTWSLLNSTYKKSVTAIHILPDNPEIIYIGTQLSQKVSGAIYRSTNGGKSWIKSLPNIRRYVSAIVSLPANHNYIYASTLDDNYHDLSKGKGIFRSTDQGKSWHRFDQNLPVYRAYDITTSNLRPYDVFLATNGSGAYIINDKDSSISRK